MIVPYAEDGGNLSSVHWSEPNGNLAAEYNAKMRATVMPVTLFVGFEVVLGFFGNLAVLYVFLFHYHTCNFRYFVLCLALTDITSTVTTMSGEMVTQLYWFTYPFPAICKVKSFFNVFTVSAEAQCLLVIAVDRYRKVCDPFGWQIKEHVAKCLCLLLYVVAAVVSIPVAFYWGTHTETEVYKDTNITVTICEIDHEYVNSKAPLDYSICIETFLCISLLAMFVMYVLIARKIFCKPSRGNVYGYPRAENGDSPRQNGEFSPADVEASQESNGRGEALRGRSPREDKMRRKTLIMFILTVTFIVTTIIYTTMLACIANEALRKLSNSERAAYFFFFRLYFINHAINPVVYGLLDSKFRQVMFFCRTSRTHGSSGSDS